MRLLLIEDDEAIADVVARGLRSEGFEVDVATDGVDGLWRAQEQPYAAILLDLLLPGRNGYQVCAQLRDAGNTTPIVVLTAKAGDLDQIDLLDLGADAFLSKPVTVSVIVAHVNALLRRGRAMRPMTVQRGTLTYDLAARECRVDGETVELTAREHAVLRAVLLADGYISRDDLLLAVWGLDFDGDVGILDVYIRRLRKKLGENRIRNQRGIGYRIDGDE